MKFFALLVFIYFENYILKTMKNHRKICKDTINEIIATKYIKNILGHG